MARFITLIIIALTFWACTPEYYCRKASKHCKPIVKDSIVYKESITYRDTMIFVDLPKDTVEVEIEIPVPMPGKPYAFDPVLKTKGIITVYVKPNGNKINVIAYLNDSTLPVQLENAIKETAYWMEKYHTSVQPPVQVKYIPPFYKFTFWWFIATCVAVVAYAAIKVKKFVA